MEKVRRLPSAVTATNLKMWSWIGVKASAKSGGFLFLFTCFNLILKIFIDFG